jgi:ribosomal protein S6--L-glutamate ligase
VRLVILSRGPQLYSTQRLHEAAVRRGHHVHILDTLAIGLVVGERPSLFYGGRAVGPYDAVVPRIGASVTLHGCAVVHQFEQLGIFALNGSSAIADSRDKLRAGQVLAAAGVPFPRTVFVRGVAQVAEAVKRVGGPPVIIKLLEGTQGVGVILADEVSLAESIVETLQHARQHVLIQRFVSESRGVDLRALVVGERVVAAMRRTARAGEFRANVHRGSRIEAAVLNKRDAQVAIDAARALDLDVAGVDMVESRGGAMVIEVNSSPGLEGIESATGVDVAGEIIEHLERITTGDERAASG